MSGWKAGLADKAKQRQRADLAKACWSGPEPWPGALAWAGPGRLAGLSDAWPGPGYKAWARLVWVWGLGFLVWSVCSGWLA